MKEIFKNIDHFDENQYCPFCNKKCSNHNILYEYEYVLQIGCNNDCHWYYGKYEFFIKNKDYSLKLIFPWTDKYSCFTSNELKVKFDLKSEKYLYFKDDNLLYKNSSNSEYRSYLIDYYLAYSKNLIFL
jgi:hypothetical protein